MLIIAQDFMTVESQNVTGGNQILGLSLVFLIAIYCLPLCLNDHIFVR